MSFSNPYNQFIMKKILLFVTVLIFTAGIYAQGDLENKGYFRIGYSKPTKTYAGITDNDVWSEGNVKRHGLILETGKFFYFNGLNFPDGLKLGINADWVSFKWHLINVKEYDQKLNNMLFGSKVGPVFSYSPVDGMAIDAYTKFNIEWFGLTVWKNEAIDESELFMGFFGPGYSFGLNFRYNALIVGFEFSRTWNKLKYLDEDEGLVEYNLNDALYYMIGPGVGIDNDADYTSVPAFNITIGLAF